MSNLFFSPIAAPSSGSENNPGELFNVGIACSVASSALTVALKTDDGSTDPSAGDPVAIAFRSATAGSGAYNVRSVTGALSVVVNSTATLGGTSGSNFYVYVGALDNAGTVELLVNSAWFDEGDIATTTTIGTGADTSGFFSTTGRSNVPVRILARLEWDTAPNGTWVVPDRIIVGPAAAVLPKDIITATSATKTPGGSGHYHQLTGNSVVVQPGTFDLCAQGAFEASGSPAFSSAAVGWFAANGADSSSAPSALSNVTGITIVSAANASFSGYQFTTINNAAGFHGTPTIRVRVDRTATLFVVTFSAQTTSSAARVTAYLNAARVA